VPSSSLGKVLEFARPFELERATLHPWPWRTPGRPFYLVNPLELRAGETSYERWCELDGAGIPFRPTSDGVRYDPLTVARYALRMHALAEATGDLLARGRARACAQALLASAVPTGIWGHGSQAEGMVGTQPFGLRQAAGISAILRGLDTRTEAGVRQVLDRAAAPLMTPLESGGALGTLNGEPFIQEMGRVSHNLGACIDGLFALYDLADGLGHEDAARSAQRIEEAIARNIELYVTPWGWSWYVLDLHGHRLLSSAHYHVGFLARVQVLALRTEQPVLVRVAERWRRALDSWHIRLLSGAAKSVQAVWTRHVLRLPLRLDS
jgi:hypothetical protein